MMTGRHTPETRAKISAKLKGHSKSKEWRAKIGAAMRGKPAHNKGVKHTAETRAKISARLMGHGTTEEARLNFRIANRVIKLFKPEMAAAIADASRARMTAQMQDPAFRERIAAGQRAYRERIAAAKAPKETAAARRQRLAAMLADGMSQADIARSIGLSPQRVHELIKKHRAICADGAGMGA